MMVLSSTVQGGALDAGEHGDRQGDGVLMARVAAGDHAAFARVYDRYSGIAYALALQLTGQPSQAQDVVQDAFLACWQRAATFEERRGSLRSWLLAMVHHRAVDLLRRARQQREATGSGELLALVPDTLSVEQEALRRVDRRQLQAALGMLPEGQRQVLDLAYYGGYRYPEIARLLGLPPGTVKSRMRLALARLSQGLAGHEGDGAPGHAG